MNKDEKKENLKKAVALKYQMFEDNAPYVLAKGQGFIAEKIIEIAKKNNIPIQEDSDLVMLLSKIEIMQEIPTELYKVVAEILAYVYRMNRKLINFKMV